MRGRDQLVKAAASRGKYSPLYAYLLSARQQAEWRVSFGELEAILGFPLPASARLHRPWWSNETKGGGHSHALAWQAAGWKTREVDLVGETLVFVRARQAEPAGTERGGGRSIGEILPVYDPGPWPAGFTASREQLYDDYGR